MAKNGSKDLVQRKVSGCLQRLVWLILIPWLATAVAGRAGETVTYYYTDPQGTVLATTDAAGSLLSTNDFRPYGSPALGSPAPGPGFTGHVSDPDSGLVYMQARFYDPLVGRFLSVDPVAPEAGNIFSLNRFAYVNNNPIGRSDPDGRQCAQCLYYPGDVDRQAQINQGASGNALQMTAVGVAALSAVPAATYVLGTAATVAADSLAAGSLTVGVMGNAEAVVASGAIIGEGVAAANGLPSPLGAEALVVRGGNAANQAAARIEAAIGESRTPGVIGFSCQCNGGTNLATLGANLRNNQLGVTTVGQIRAAGGEVVATPGYGSHVTVTGLSGEQASPLFNIVKNPNPSGGTP